ncbi:E3 ubiquitin-protein ligase RNF8-like protein [Leptotrombidium deliense]|uniref:E3 ubiquitin-protein ligase RNF8-like protein n=1 Tax=Leptotrombidium deliense TaxID=299467 RepID=A0A443S3T9_9ACAR|nr:E3 ubiquitin-protein ligase RNF8-like protein [Leptotrombidium deliense]
METPEIAVNILLNKQRNTECDIRIKNVEISRRHARLIKINNVWQLIDLKSTNGVYVNGDKIKPLVPKSLCNKHIISFGPPERTDFVYRFYQNVEDYKVKADKKRIKLVEKQIEEHSLSEEILNEVSNEAKDVTGLNEPEADAGVYGQQKKRKYGNLENG